MLSYNHICLEYFRHLPFYIKILCLTSKQGSQSCTVACSQTFFLFTMYCTSIYVCQNLFQDDDATKSMFSDTTTPVSLWIFEVTLLAIQHSLSWCHIVALLNPSLCHLSQIQGKNHHRANHSIIAMFSPFYFYPGVHKLILHWISQSSSYIRELMI